MHRSNQHRQAGDRARPCRRATLGKATAVIVSVAGHIIAVTLAHVAALRVFADRRAAMRSQYPLLVLMVGYTVVSRWIFAQSVVEAG